MARRIAVIGGGVIGCSVAWQLMERGLGEVTLVERHSLGSGTTWHSAGNVTWKPITSHDAPVLYMFETIERLERESGQSTSWLETGRLFLARSDRGMAKFAGQAREAEARGYRSRLLDPAAASGLHPLIEPTALAGAWYNGLSGRLNPTDLVAAYARAAKRLGARIRENCGVTGIVSKNGRVRRLETSGGRIEADAVVVCAGLWSRHLLLDLDIALAQGGCEHFYLIGDTEPRLSRETPSFVSPEDLLYGREETGKLLFGCFDTAAKTLDIADLPEHFAFSLLEPDWDKFAPYFEKAVELFPALAETPIRRFVNGPEAFTPDGQPLIGPLPGIEGLYVCSAMNSTGVTLSAAAGRMIADIVADVSSDFDTSSFRPDRFGDKAADETWLRHEVSGSPSRGYRQANM